MARRRFKSLDDLRRYGADVLNRLESGQLDDSEAKGRMYCVNILSNVISSSEIEGRLDKLEQAVTEDTNSKPAATVTPLRRSAR